MKKRSLFKSSKQIVQIVLFVLISAWSVLGKTPAVEKGMINLQGYEFGKSDFVALDGEWQIKWMSFYTAGQMDTISRKHYGYVPGSWVNYTIDGKPCPAHGYMTYYLRVILRPSHPKRLGIRMQTAGTAYELFVDGRFVGSNGRVGINAEQTQDYYLPKIHEFDRDNDTLNIVIYVATFRYRKGGLWESVYLGLPQAVRSESERLIFFDIFLLGSLLMMAIYHVGLFALRRDDRLSLYFAILCFSMIIRLISTGEKLLIRWVEDFPWQWLIKLEFGSIMVAPIALTMFLDELYPKMMSRWFRGGVVVIFSVFIAITLLTNSGTSSYLIILTNTLWTPVLLYILILVVRAAILRKPDSLVMALGIVISFIFVVNEILYNANILNTGYTLPWAIFIFFFWQAFLLSRRFSRAFLQISKLSEELRQINLTLENKVAQRTKELMDMTQEALELNREMQATLKIVEDQNKQIQVKNENITASINYARRIQQGILPTSEQLQAVLGDYFLIYEPKDIVSGDFYWCYSDGKVHFFALADCTGHGVPGAFMSLIGATLLSDLVRTNPESSPATLISQLHRAIRRVLRQEGRMGQDGMDLALLKIIPSECKIEFAGSGRPLFYVSHGQSYFIRGGRSFVNIKDGDNAEPFQEHVIVFDSDTMVYLYTDGFTDQFGGELYTKYGMTRLHQLLSRNYDQPIEIQQEVLLNEFLNWKANFNQTDDVSLVGFRPATFKRDNQNHWNFEDSIMTKKGIKTKYPDTELSLQDSKTVSD